MTITPATTLDPDRLLAHRAWVRAVAARLVRDPHLAEDLAQDAFVNALESPPRDPGALRAWFRTVMRRRVISEHRSTERRTTRERAAGGPGAVRPPEDVVADAEAHRRVVAAVLALDEPYRTTVLLHYYEGLSLPELSRRMDVPYDTARTRLRRARERLRGHLDREHGGLAGWAVPLFGPQVLDGGSASAHASTRAPLAAAAIAMGVIVLALVVWSALPGDGASASDVASDLANVAARTPGAAAAGNDAAEDDDTSAIAGRDRAPRERVTVPDEPDGREEAATADDEADATAKAPEAPRVPIPTRILHGVVRDPAGISIDGADVYVDPWAADTGSAVEADTAGRFEIVVPDCGPVDDGGVLRQTRLRVSARGFLTRHLEPWDLPDGVTIVLQPQPVAALVVRVLGPDGAPVSGQDVYVGSSDRTIPGLRNALATDGRGEVHVRRTFPGGSSVHARAESAAGAQAYETTVLDAEGGGVIVLRFSAQRRVRMDVAIDGAVGAVRQIEFDPKLPLARAVAWPGGSSAEITLPAAVTSVRAVSLAGFGPWVDVIGETRVSVPLGTHAAVPVELDATGIDVQYTRITVMFWEADRDVAQVSTPLAELRGSDGRYVLPMAPGGFYVAAISGSGRMRQRPLVPPEDGPIRLADAADSLDVAVHVVSDGAPVVGAHVEAVSIGTTTVSATTDDSGNAQLSLAVGVRYDVHAAAPGRSGASTRITPAPGLAPVMLDLPLAAMRLLRVKGLGSARAMAMRFAPGAGPQALTAENDVLSVPASDSDWTLLMTERGAWFLAAGTFEGAAVDLTATRDDLVDVAIEGSARWILVAAQPHLPGVHAVASPMVGALTVPPGRYVLFEAGTNEATLHGVLDIEPGAGRFEPTLRDPGDEGWQHGEAPAGTSGTLVLDVEGSDGVRRAIPLSPIQAGRITRWRSVGPPPRLVPAR